MHTVGIESGKAGPSVSGQANNAPIRSSPMSTGSILSVCSAYTGVVALSMRLLRETVAPLEILCRESVIHTKSAPPAGRARRCTACESAAECRSAARRAEKARKLPPVSASALRAAKLGQAHKSGDSTRHTARRAELSTPRTTARIRL